MRVLNHFTRSLSIVLPLWLLGGCASQSAEPALAAARLAVQEARQSEAPILAPRTFDESERELAAAQEAEDRGDETRARRLAEEASVDARLAVAHAEFEDARLARTDVENAINSRTRP